jgi:copper oxidase (laccase) domain-containing protein
VVGFFEFIVSISNRVHGNMSFVDFENLGFRLGDSIASRTLRQAKSFLSIRRQAIANRLAFIKACEIDPRQVFCPTLGLTDKVAVVRKSNSDQFTGKGLYFKGPACDAVITDIPDLSIMFLPGDCPVTVLFDQRQGILAQIHNGRENIFKNIAGKTARMLKENFSCDPGDIIVRHSPSLCPECHTLTYLMHLVGDPEFEKIRPAIVENESGWQFDMRKATELQLGAEGIDRVIADPPVCTLCDDKEEFFSHRGWVERHPNHSDPGRFAVVSRMVQL